MVCALLVLYDEQAGLVIEHFAPWLDLRVPGILAICANIVSVSVRLYVVFNPPDSVVIYWNLLYYSAVILASVLLILLRLTLLLKSNLARDQITAKGKAA